MRKKFRKGQLAHYNGCIVLVTGPGDKTEGYPCFSGVVVKSWKTNNQDKPWPIGMYSMTWVTSAFQKTNKQLAVLSVF